MNPDLQPSGPHIIGYDAEGRPIYDAPPQQPQVSPLVRATEGSSGGGSSDDTQNRHRESVEAYPTLNLSSDEYVVLDVRRHAIGLALPMVVITIIVALILTVLVSLPSVVAQFAPTQTIPYGWVWLGGLVIIGLCLVGGAIAAWVYRNNQLIVTNESVVQRLQNGLLMHDEQTANIGSIENVNYEQNGLMQMMFNYGTITMRTVGDETSYGLTYVSDPRRQVATINTAIETYKNNKRSAE